MYSRPKAGETEEDLLRLQKEFEANKARSKIEPAAKFVSSKSKNDEMETQSESVASSRPQIEEQLANTFEAIPQDMKLKSVVENTAGNQPRSLFTFSKSRGFPQAKRRDCSYTPGKASIFAQHIKKLKKDEMPMEVDVPQTSQESLQIKARDENLPSESYIITGSDSKQIHEENLSIIKSLSEDEILEERQRLIATMDPAIIAFLKSKRQKDTLQNRNPTIKEQNEAAEDVQVEDIDTMAELLAQPEAEKWLNFDVVETSKLAWMKNIDIPKLKARNFEARFDFEGWLLPYSQEEISEKNRILYHHGEEPGRPGYTLQELFQLSRSSIIQQKILALNSIANILSLNSTGVYDEIIDLPIEQIFFVLRFSLDDNTPAVLNASIKAMRNLFFSQIDETCLDGLLGFGIGMIQPILAVDHETEDDNTVNDQQLAEKNLVRCLARTEILTRIRYIINTVKPTLETIVYSIEILIRLARDSEFVSRKIMNCENLLESVVKNFLPQVLDTTSSSSPYGLPLLQAVKLLRVISSRSKIFAEKLKNKYKVLDSIVVYLSNDIFSGNVNGLRLQAECMHFWSILLHYGLGLDYFSVLQPTLLNLLDYHFKHTDFNMETTFIRQAHVSALLVLIGNTVRKNYILGGPFLPLVIEKCAPKWIAQFELTENYACGKLQIIASLVYCLSCFRKYQQNKQLDVAIIKIINSRGFMIVTNNIKSGSMLLNNYDTHKSSSNLRTLETAAWYTMDHVVPIVQTNSSIPFLCALSHYVQSTDCRKVKLSFLQHSNIENYLTSLRKLEKYYLTDHWFARMETTFILNVLKTSVSIKDVLDIDLFYGVTVKCLSVFNYQQKEDIAFLLENIVFCSKFYPSEALMARLDITERSESLEVSLSNLDEIREVYTQVLGLRDNVVDLETSSVDVSLGNVIPIDWIYMPILVLYSNQLQNKTNVDETRQIFIVKNCLRWVLIYETYFPFLASSINPTDRFCRLACLFLGSDSLFLTKEIHDLLEVCFKNVMGKFEDQLDFDKEIKGLSNFQDFYTQLLEQYQSVSYGDVLFGNVILVPLARRHKVQYRKTLWSEYMGAVQIFNVISEECLCNLELFLEPPEEDMSLLKCYRRAMVNNLVRKQSVLYKIANHHVERFVDKRRQEKNKE